MTAEGKPLRIAFFGHAEGRRHRRALHLQSRAGSLAPRPQLRCVVELLAHAGEVRPAPFGEPRGEGRRGAERLGDVEQVSRGQPATAPRPLERPAHVASSADRRLGLLGEEARGLVGLVVEQADVGSIRERQGRIGQLVRWGEGGQAGQLADDRGKFERPQGARIGCPRRRPDQRRDRWGSSRTA